MTQALGSTFQRWPKQFVGFRTNLTIVVDGMMNAQTQKLYAVTLTNLPSNNVRVVALSRPERDIHAALRCFSSFEVDQVSTETDIGIYIDWRLNHDHQLCNIKPQLKEHIKERLPTKLWGNVIIRRSCRLS